MWLILLLFWFFDLITFRAALGFWLGWVTLNILVFILTGWIGYSMIALPTIELFQ